MNTFEELKLSKPIQSAIDDLGFVTPTPIQKEAMPVVMAGKDVVGIAQTGTGKTIAYILPILKQFTFSQQLHPRVLVLVPTRELVNQVVEEFQSVAKYMSVRILGIYGGTNINTQKAAVAEGCDIIVATPGRLYDIALTGVLSLKGIKKLVIDEVDVMLDLGFRFQLQNLFEILPERRQNTMFSATMTEEVELLIDDYFNNPEKISIAVSGTPLNNIAQYCYKVPNFNTKVNLLVELLWNKEEFTKVLVFVENKRMADRIFTALEEEIGMGIAVIHSNKSQNYRERSVKQFDEGEKRILVATDVIARGIDFEKISHVINFDTPKFPENYMHRIGRTGRAENEGHSILLYTDREREYKTAIEELMGMTITRLDMPEEVEVSTKLIPEEEPKVNVSQNRATKVVVAGGEAYHEKSEKNKKTNQGGSYRKKLAAKYSKPKTRGDKNINKKKEKAKKNKGRW